MSQEGTPGGSGPLAPLGVVSLPRATAYPLHPGDLPERARLGVLAEDGSLLESTIDDRHHGAQLYVPPRPEELPPVDHAPGEAVYAGVFQKAFGHFLLESLQRLWWVADRPDLPVVWVAGHDAPAPELTGWQREMLDVVGIHNEVRVLTRPTRFDLLHVPDAGYKYADWSHPQHIAFLAAHEGPPQEEGTRLWLSRGRAWGGVTNRHIIERRLRARGWTIATFDAMPLRDQLDALARAEVIAGEEGSTFHNLLLLRDVSGKKFHIFRRYGREHLSFRTIGDARQVDQEFHACSEDVVVSVTGRRVARLAPNPSQYLSHLHMKPGARRPLPEGWEPGPTIRLVNRLAEHRGATTFLQLGRRHPGAFTEIAVPSRDYVQQHFPFDVRAYRDTGAAFYEVGFEDFFTWFLGERTYDLVLVGHDDDWRALVGRVRTVVDTAAHAGTVVVIDHAGPVEGRPEVQRVLAAVHDLHPDLDHRTVGDARAARTVVWRHAREVAPTLHDEDDVENADDAVLASHPGVGAHVTEEQLLAALAGEDAPAPDVTSGPGGKVGLGRVLRRG